MSIHTTIESNIHHLDDLVQILDSQRIRWERTPVTFKGGSKKAFCGVLAWINGEAVLIYQERPGEPFIFQSEEWFFRNKSNMETLALDGMEMVARKKREEKNQRQGLQEQVAGVLQRMEAERVAKRQDRNKPNAGSSPEPPSSGSLKNAIGKFHQQNALHKIITSLETLDQEAGLSLYSQETLEDETIELILRG